MGKGGQGSGGMNMGGSLDLVSYAFYADDGGEAGSTQIGTTGNPVTLEAGTLYHCRLLIQETAGSGGSIAPDWFWMTEDELTSYNISFPSSNALVVPSDSAHLVQGDDTTQRIGSGAFVADNGGVSETGDSDELSYEANEEFEVVLSFQIDSDSTLFEDDRVIKFKLSGLDSRTNPATLTMTQP